MRNLMVLAVLAGLVGFAPAAEADRATADAAIKRAPGIVSTRWAQNISYWVAVQASGTPRTFGLIALHVCRILRQHKVRGFVVVTVIDASYVRLGKFKSLAKERCPS